MKAFNITLVTALSAASLLLAGCTSPATTIDAKAQIADVQRGNLSIDITASGNLALSITQDCAFELSGHVAEVLIEEGDYVRKGQLLAKLDDDTWKTSVKSLEDRVTAAERSLTAKQRDLETTQLNLKTAEYNLWVIDDVKKANDQLEDTKLRLKIAQSTQLEWAAAGATNAFAAKYWSEVITALVKEIRDKEKALDDVLTGHSTTLTPNVNSQVELKKVQVDMALAKVDDANIAIDDARRTLKEAQDDLNEAKSTSVEVKAPFDGFVTRVPVIGGQEIFKGAVAATVADLTRFEAVVLVSEKDISSVKDGGAATVSVEAIPQVSFPAKITRIAPTATIASGVVNYQVKVELDPSKLSQTSQVQAIPSASVTGGQTASSGRPAPAAGQAAIPQITLRPGLSITVNFPVSQRNNVLVVPNRAITRQGKDTVVQVLKDGVTTARVVKIGINDWQNTEVTEGITDGEQVVIPMAKLPTTSTTFGGSAVGAAVGAKPTEVIIQK